MFLHQQPIGVYELLMALRSKGLEERSGGADYLLSLIAECPDDHGALRASEQLRDFWTRRRVAQALDDLKRTVLAPEAPGEKVDHAAIMEKITSAMSANDAGKAILDASDRVEAAMVRPVQSARPSIGIANFDQKMSLFHPGEMTIVAGRPGGGKSSLMRQIIWRASTSNPVLVFTLEVEPDVLIRQLCCEAAGVPFESWRDGAVSEEKCQEQDSKIGEAILEFDLRKIKIYTKARVAAMQVAIALAQLRAEGSNPSAVVIDYLGLMDHGKAERNDLAIGQTTRALKLLALEQKVPIILLCQMNRESEKRGNGSEHDRPRLADLRDSGNIEQDADNIIFLWKKERDDNKMTTQARVLTIAKHRNGHVGDIDVLFDMPGGRFYDATNGFVGK
jgi:replicative DNA helicase